MKRQVIVCFGWFVLYAVAAVVLDAVDAPPWVWLATVLAAIAGSHLYGRLLLPRRARERMLNRVDPTVGPPHGAAPADVPLIEHLSMLSDAKDYDALRSLLSDDFAIVAGRFTLEAGDYIRSLKASDWQVPGTRTTDEVVVHPDEPDIVWVRSTASRKPRFGPGYVSTTWTRVSVTPDRTQVLSIDHAGVTQVI
jgi:hypothetical protein